MSLVLQDCSSVLIGNSYKYIKKTIFFIGKAVFALWTADLQLFFGGKYGLFGSSGYLLTSLASMITLI